MENTQNLFSISYPLLISKGQPVRRFGLQDYVSTISEFQWALSQVSYPFTRLEEPVPQDYSSIQDLLDQCPHPHVVPQQGERSSPTSEAAQKDALLSGERDASAAILLTTPYINEGTFVHEIGCWNGQNLINLLFYNVLHGRVPKYCLGTNINSLALSMAESTASLFKIDGSLMNFCLANALEPFDPSFLNLGFHSEVKLALRVIPVLEPSYAVEFLKSVRASIQCKEATLVVSYAVPKGTMYETNLSRSQDSSQPQFTKKDFVGGETFYASFSNRSLLPKYLQAHDDPHVVLNTYYSEEGFAQLVEKGGFEVLETIRIERDTDNERIVALLVPK